MLYFYDSTFKRFCLLIFVYLFFTYFFFTYFVYLLIVHLFTYFWLHGSQLLCIGFLQLGERGLLSCCSEWASHCGGSSCHGAQAVGHLGFTSFSSRALENEVSSCGSWAQLSCGIWDLPGPGIKSMFPALEGGFLTTRPPEKSPKMIIM